MCTLFSKSKFTVKESHVHILDLFIEYLWHVCPFFSVIWKTSIISKPLLRKTLCHSWDGRWIQSYSYRCEYVDDLLPEACHMVDLWSPECEHVLDTWGWQWAATLMSCRWYSDFMRISMHVLSFTLNVISTQIFDWITLCHLSSECN